MRSSYERQIAEANETERQFRQNAIDPAKNVRPPLFGPIAKIIWPIKTAANLASIAGTSERAASRWLSGEIEPPGILLAAMLVEITKRE